MKTLAMDGPDVALLNAAPDNKGFLRGLEILKRLQIPESELLLEKEEDEKA